MFAQSSQLASHSVVWGSVCFRLLQRHVRYRPALDNMSSVSYIHFTFCLILFQVVAVVFGFFITYAVIQGIQLQNSLKHPLASASIEHLSTGENINTNPNPNLIHDILFFSLFSLLCGFFPFVLCQR